MSVPAIRPNTAQINERRSQVWQLFKAGATQRAIARTLRVSHTTVQRDVRAVLDELRAEQLDAAHDWQVRQLSRLEDQYRKAWEVVIAEGDNREPSHSPLDRARAQLVCMRVMREEAKLLGLYAPELHVHTGPDGGAIEHEHRHELADMDETDIDRELRELQDIEGVAREVDEPAAATAGMLAPQAKPPEAKPEEER